MTDYKVYERMIENLINRNEYATAKEIIETAKEVHGEEIRKIEQQARDYDDAGRGFMGCLYSKDFHNREFESIRKLESMLDSLTKK